MNQVARHVGWKSVQTAQYYSQVPKVAKGSVKGKDNISHAESMGVEFRARNNLERLSLGFP